MNNPRQTYVCQLWFLFSIVGILFRFRNLMMGECEMVACRRRVLLGVACGPDLSSFEG